MSEEFRVWGLSVGGGNGGWGDDVGRRRNRAHLFYDINPQCGWCLFRGTLISLTPLFRARFSISTTAAFERSGFDGELEKCVDTLVKMKGNTSEDMRRRIKMCEGVYYYYGFKRKEDFGAFGLGHLEWPQNIMGVTQMREFGAHVTGQEAGKVDGSMNWAMGSGPGN